MITSENYKCILEGAYRKNASVCMRKLEVELVYIHENIQTYN